MSWTDIVVWTLPIHQHQYQHQLLAYLDRVIEVDRLVVPDSSYRDVIQEMLIVASYFPRSLGAVRPPDLMYRMSD